MTLIHLLGGLIYLLMGGDLLVRGAVALARRARVPPVVVALSVVALGTSLPELLVTLRAVLSGYPAIGIGNVVGSNIANVLLVVGLPAILYPVAIAEDAARRDSVIMLAVSVIFLILCYLGILNRVGGVLLLSGLGVWLVYAGRDVARATRQADRSLPMEWVLGLPTQSGMIALFIVAGTVGLPLGANMFVRSASEIATQLNVSEAVIGVTLVAIGTSLPELTTCVVAGLQRRTDVSLGTAIGSNMFNIVAIMGTASVVSPTPIPVPPGFLTLDLPVMLGASLVLTFLVWRRRTIGRSVGAALAVAYFIYLGALFGLS